MSQESQPILEVKGLTRRFGGLVAVDNVTLSFYPGKLQSIIGPNGAGKTTFFNLLSGMFPPSSGEIFFKGMNITRLSPPERFRRRIVRTFQISSIFPELCVLKNVEIAAQGRYRTSNSPWGRLSQPQKRIHALCLSALETLQLSDKKDQRAGLLAYGDKRRLEIAMGLVSDPEILLLDEPTAGMSPEETEKTAAFLRDLSRKVTLILVEHDMKVVMNISDRVTVLHHGLILADGPPQEIRNNPDVQTVYLSGCTI
jgi:branched-chain amino acid transport system ATP-binding protein